jgi:hypothetical protein
MGSHSILREAKSEQAQPSDYRTNLNLRDPSTLRTIGCIQSYERNPHG